MKNREFISKNISSKLYDNLFYFGVKGELLYSKLKTKKHYIELKNILFHTSKTELKETYQMIKLLLKKNRTKGENEFIQEQLGDLGRISILGTSGVAPGGFIIFAILHKLGIDLKPSALKEYKKKK